MEKARICKICSKRFSNGKAMGGHMRSHLAKFPLPPKPQHLQSPISISSSSSSSPRFPSQSYRSVNHDLLQASRPRFSTAREREREVESDSESPVATTRRRSKRLRKSAAESVVKAAETSPEQVSSLSDEMLSEEEVALCLLMLSRDTEKARDRIEGAAKMAEVEVEEEDDEDEDELFDEIPLRSKSNFKYKCTTCKKNFRSYQALGGHKASHKKIKKEDNCSGADSGGNTADGGGSGAVAVDQKTFKCPFCDKVFESGQALGGHKKVHFSYLGNNNNDAKAVTPKPKMFAFDLNLPAPEEDDDVVELESGQVYELRNR